MDEESLHFALAVPAAALVDCGYLDQNLVSTGQLLPVLISCELMLLLSLLLLVVLLLLAA